MTPPSDGNQINSHDSVHHIYKLSMKNGETWAVDARGTLRASSAYLSLAYLPARTLCKHHGTTILWLSLVSSWVFSQFTYYKSLGRSQRETDPILGERIWREAGQNAQRTWSKISGSEARLPKATWIICPGISWPGVQEHRPINQGAKISYKSSPVSWQYGIGPACFRAFWLQGCHAVGWQALCHQGDTWKGKRASCYHQDCKGHMYTLQSPYFHSSARHLQYPGIRRHRRKGDRQTWQGWATGFLRSGKHLRGCPQQTSGYCVGLFLDASRINHSFRNTWNENNERITIHALRDIEEGQEITISYLGQTREYAER